MRIQDTELDYDDQDADILDYYLGGESETKEQWAKRVWDNCERQANGEELASVYIAEDGQSWQDRARFIWENKKAMRKKAIKKELKIEDNDLKDIKKNPKYSKRSERIDLSRSTQELSQELPL